MPARPAAADAASLVQRIVDGVAVIHDTNPMELSPPLYESVDPDALERVIQQSDRQDLTVEFDYHGCTITVEGDGSVTVSPIAATRTDTS